MYKVVIQTTSKHRPQKTPILSSLILSQNKLAEPQMQTLLEQSEFSSQKKPLISRIHLLRNIDHSHKLIQKIKSRALLILNYHHKEAEMHKILKERHMEIEAFFVFCEQIDIHKDKEHKNKVDKEISSLHAVVVTKTVVIAEEIGNFVGFGFACFFVDNVTILQVQTFSILNSLKQQFPELSQQLKENWVEIPHCKKCLQILEPEVTGLNTHQYLTGKYFSEPEQTGCKVCYIRQIQQLRCSQCQQIDDNWVCMVCGIVGCGRYKNADAFKHYCLSKHILSLDLKTNRIWNYKLDCFCHKINKQDETMEESQPDLLEQIDDQNIELQFWKYCNVVSEQLDKQRNFYNKIKQEEIQRYSSEEKVLQNRIDELAKLREQKKEMLKKKVKRNKKIFKKFSQLQEQCKQERELTKMLEQSAKNKDKFAQTEKQSIIILKKRQQLRRIQSEIEKALSNLTEA